MPFANRFWNEAPYWNAVLRRMHTQDNAMPDGVARCSVKLDNYEPLGWPSVLSGRNNLDMVL